MLGPTFVMLATLTVSSRPPGRSGTHGRPRHAAVRRLPAIRADELYSLRARRRFAAYLRMRLLEMREAGLERAAAVVEHRLPLESLVPEPAEP